MQSIKLPSGTANARSGYTLLELLVSSTAATLLMVGMGTAVVITSRAVAPDVAQKDILDAVEATFVMGDELQSAIRMTHLENSAVEFALHDRDGDQLPERIRYDLQNDQLQRTLNGTRGVLQEDVDSVSFSPQYRSVPETVGGVLSESDVGALAGITYGLNLRTWSLDPHHPVGQYLDVDHPPDATMWSVLTTTLFLRRSSVYLDGEVFTVQLREATGDGLPTSNVIDETRVAVSSLSTSFRIVTVRFDNADRLPVSKQLCVVVKADESLYGSAVKVAFASWGFRQSGHFLSTTGGDADWVADDGKGLYFLAAGTRHELDDSTLQVERPYLTGITVEVAGAAEGSLCRRRIRLLNTPAHTSGLWRLDFNRSPVDAIDADFDGQDDWVYSGPSGAFEPAITDSRLTLSDGDELQAVANNNFAGLITVDLHCRGLVPAAGRGGAFLQFPFGADSNNHGQITVSVEQTTAGSQTVTVVAADGADGQTVARIRQLPDDIVECRVVVDPATNFVAVWVNETFQGRTLVTQPLTGTAVPVTFGASGADAEFDFLSLQVTAPVAL